jgi:hypothetical protein
VLREKLKYFKKYDLFIILFIFIISFLSWFFYQYFISAESPRAEIYYYSKLVKTVDLGQDKERFFSIEENPNVVFHLFEDGGIRFEESDCPHKLCVKAGKLSRVGEFAACLPNGIILKIVPSNNKDREVDIVVGN